jgi:hypothetical protein
MAPEPDIDLLHALLDSRMHPGEVLPNQLNPPKKVNTKYDEDCSALITPLVAMTPLAPYVCL